MKKVISGGITWRFRRTLSNEFIRGAFKSKWEEWRGDSFYVHVEATHRCFSNPRKVAEHDVDRGKFDPRDEDLKIALARIKALREWGLTSNMVAAYFT